MTTTPTTTRPVAAPPRPETTRPYPKPLRRIDRRA